MRHKLILLLLFPTLLLAQNRIDLSKQLQGAVGGDIILYDASGEAVLLSIGSAGQALLSNGTTASWDSLSYNSLTDTPGTITASNGLTRVADDIKLGGALTEFTSISGGEAHGLYFDDLTFLQTYTALGTSAMDQYIDPGAMYTQITNSGVPDFKLLLWGNEANGLYLENVKFSNGEIGAQFLLPDTDNAKVLVKNGATNWVGFAAENTGAALELNIRDAQVNAATNVTNYVLQAQDANGRAEWTDIPSLANMGSRTAGSIYFQSATGDIDWAEDNNNLFWDDAADRLILSGNAGSIATNPYFFVDKSTLEKAVDMGSSNGYLRQSMYGTSMQGFRAFGNADSNTDGWNVTFGSGQLNGAGSFLSELDDGREMGGFTWNYWNGSTNVFVAGIQAEKISTGNYVLKLGAESNVDGPGDIELYSGDQIKLPDYPSTRNDTATSAAENFLYTDISGNLLSAPADGLFNAGDRTKGSVYYQGATGPIDWAEDNNNFYYNDYRKQLMMGHGGDTISTSYWDFSNSTKQQISLRGDGVNMLVSNPTHKNYLSLDSDGDGSGGISFISRNPPGTAWNNDAIRLYRGKTNLSDLNASSSFFDFQFDIMEDGGDYKGAYQWPPLSISAIDALYALDSIGTEDIFTIRSFAGDRWLQVKWDGSLQFKKGYKNTRNDTGVTTPENFLYTDATGMLQSAPATGLLNAGTRTEGSIYYQGVAGAIDWAEDNANLFYDDVTTTMQIGSNTAPTTLLYAGSHRGLEVTNDNDGTAAVVAQSFRNAEWGSKFLGYHSRGTKSVLADVQAFDELAEFGGYANHTSKWHGLGGFIVRAQSIDATNIEGAILMRVHKSNLSTGANSGSSDYTFKFDKLLMSPYPSTRVDTADYAPENFLYTDISGNVLSAPADGLFNAGDRTEGSIYYQSADGAIDWTEKANEFYFRPADNKLAILSPGDEHWNIETIVGQNNNIGNSSLLTYNQYPSGSDTLYYMTDMRPHGPQTVSYAPTGFGEMTFVANDGTPDARLQRTANPDTLNQRILSSISTQMYQDRYLGNGIVSSIYSTIEGYTGTVPVVGMEFHVMDGVNVGRWGYGWPNPEPYLKLGNNEVYIGNKVDAIRFANWPNTRSDTATTAVENFLYTDISGNVLSAPSGALSAGVNYWTKTGNDIYYTAGQVRVGDGTVSLPSLALNDDTNTGFFSPGVDIISASAGGLEVFRFANGYSSAFNQLRLSDGAVGAPGLSFNDDTNLGIYSPGADVLGIVTAGAERLRVDASGSVGIGTTSPQSNIHINTASTGALRITGASSGHVNASVILESTQSAERGAGVYMHNSFSDTEWYAGRPYLDGDKYMIGRVGSIAVHSDATATYTNAFLTVANTGAVGIGTTSPDRKLSISTTGGGGMNLVSTDATAQQVISFKDSGGETGAIIYEHTGDKLWLKTNGAERFSISSAGALTLNNYDTNEVSPTIDGVAYFDTGSGVLKRASVADIVSAGSLWTDSGANTYLTSTSDNVIIGAATNPESAKFFVNSTDTRQVARFENSYSSTTPKYSIAAISSGALGTGANYASYSHVTATGGTNNYAGYFHAAGATTNYGVYVNSGNSFFGSYTGVGITPGSAYMLDVQSANGTQQAIRAKIGYTSGSSKYATNAEVTGALGAGANHGHYAYVGATGASINYGNRSIVTGATGTNTGYKAEVSGTATNAYGGHFVVTNTGTTNYAGYFHAAGATNNYGVYVNSGQSFFGGAVGINKVPAYDLDVDGRINAEGDDSPTGSGIAMGVYSTNGYAWLQSFASRPLYINKLGNNTIINSDAGNVAIGTTTPGARLEVAGGGVKVSGHTSNKVINVQAGQADTELKMTLSNTSLAASSLDESISLEFQHGFIVNSARILSERVGDFTVAGTRDANLELWTMEDGFQYKGLEVMPDADIQVTQYGSARDDSSTDPVGNMLYTDASGNMRSAPVPDTANAVIFSNGSRLTSYHADFNYDPDGKTLFLGEPKDDFKTLWGAVYSDYYKLALKGGMSMNFDDNDNIGIQFSYDPKGSPFVGYYLRKQAANADVLVMNEAYDISTANLSSLTDTEVGLKTLRFSFYDHAETASMGAPVHHNTSGLDPSHRLWTVNASTGGWGGYEDLIAVRLNGGLLLPKYPSTRNDTSSYVPVNFLYTDVSGNVLSAPFDAINTNIVNSSLTATAGQVQNFAGFNQVWNSLGYLDVNTTTGLDLNNTGLGGVVISNSAAGDIDINQSNAAGNVDIDAGQNITADVTDGSITLKATNTNVSSVSVSALEVNLNSQPASANGNVIFESNSNVFRQGSIHYQDMATVTQFSGSAHNVNLGSTDSQVFKISSASDVDFTGIAPSAGQTGEVIVLFNTGSYNITLKSENVLSTTTNRFKLPEARDHVMLPNHSVTMWYDFNETRWRMISGTTTPEVYRAVTSASSDISGSASTSTSFNLNSTLLDRGDLVNGSNVIDVPTGADGLYKISVRIIVGWENNIGATDKVAGGISVNSNAQIVNLVETKIGDDFIVDGTDEVYIFAGELTLDLVASDEISVLVWDFDGGGANAPTIHTGTQITIEKID